MTRCTSPSWAPGTWVARSPASLADGATTCALWGTWLDDGLLEACERGAPHPRLKLALDGIALLRSARLAEALGGAELVVLAVNSEGVVPVMTRAVGFLLSVPVLSVTKGLLESSVTGHMDRVDVVAAQALRRAVRFVHAGGPAKAMEIARGVLTWMQFAGSPDDAERRARALFATMRWSSA